MIRQTPAPNEIKKRIMKNNENNEKPFAVFVVAPTKGVVGDIAATTRPTGGIGLPGGKVEENETAVEAVLREAAEEGWSVSGLNPEPIHEAVIDGKLVQWFVAASATKLVDYKEIGRVTPVAACRFELTHGFGNEFLKDWELVLFISRHTPTIDQVAMMAKERAILYPVGDRDAFTLDPMEFQYRKIITVHPAMALRLLPVVEAIGIFENSSRPSEGGAPSFSPSKIHWFSVDALL